MCSFRKVYFIVVFYCGILHRALALKGAKETITSVDMVRFPTRKWLFLEALLEGVSGVSVTVGVTAATLHFSTQNGELCGFSVTA